MAVLLHMSLLVRRPTSLVYPTLKVLPMAVPLHILLVVRRPTSIVHPTSLVQAVLLRTIALMLVLQRVPMLVLLVLPVLPVLLVLLVPLAACGGAHRRRRLQHSNHLPP